MSDQIMIGARHILDGLFAGKRIVADHALGRLSLAEVNQRRERLRRRGDVADLGERSQLAGRGWARRDGLLLKAVPLARELRQLGGQRDVDVLDRGLVVADPSQDERLIVEGDLDRLLELELLALELVRSWEGPDAGGRG